MSGEHDTGVFRRHYSSVATELAWPGAMDADLCN